MIVCMMIFPYTLNSYVKLFMICVFMMYNYFIIISLTGIPGSHSINIRVLRLCSDAGQ